MTAHFLKELILILICMCVWGVWGWGGWGGVLMCICECRCLQKPEEAIRFPSAGVTSNCKQSDKSTGSWTWVLCKNSTWSLPLILPSSPVLVQFCAVCITILHCLFQNQDLKLNLKITNFLPQTCLCCICFCNKQHFLFICFCLFPSLKARTLKLLGLLFHLTS